LPIDMPRITLCMRIDSRRSSSSSRQSVSRYQPAAQTQLMQQQQMQSTLAFTE
jgi:hypothetical protein